MQCGGRNGSPYVGIVDRLLANSYHAERGCWIWLGYRCGDGYGRVSMWCPVTKRHVTRLAHRVSYTAFKGAIPEGHDLDHRATCSRACINPEHLTPMPYREHRRKTGFRFPRANPPKQLSLQALD